MELKFKSYSIILDGDYISVFLNGRRYAVLKAGSSLDTPDNIDVDETLGDPEITQCEGFTTVMWQTRSNLWKHKTYTFRFEEDCFSYGISVRGNQDLDKVRYFNGGAERWEEWSHFDFSRFFTPECALLDQRYYRSMQYGCIDAATGKMSEFDVDGYAAMHWIFCPPPMCYSLGFSDGPWLGAGVIPKIGEYNFSRFEYYPSPNSFCLRLTYDGMTSIDGEWTSPEVFFIPGEDEYSAINRFCDIQRTHGYSNRNNYERADWWSKPIFCGWGEQNIFSARDGKGRRGANSFATQESYDGFLRIMDEKGLKPGTIVIDDKWQEHYGINAVDEDKWPDLRSWIDARHAEGRKVLLWFGAWNCEGLPSEECIKDSEGNQICVDPTNPGYSKRIREMMHRMLSSDPGCYNADGIKYDWTNGVPVGYGYQLHGNIWGIELLKSLTQQIYDALKAAKSDALMITHAANPYFAECTDMLRLNDIFRGARDIVPMMKHRAKIARMACPHALIDCDNSSAPTHTEWFNYTLAQPEIGVPSLYFLTAVDGNLEEITEDDWNRLAHIWRVSQ